MRYKNAPLTLAVSAAVFALAQPGQALAQNNAQAQLEEVVVTGTRSQRERTVSDSPVPVDVLSSEEIKQPG